MQEPENQQLYNLFYIKVNELSEQNSDYYGATVYQINNKKEIFITMDLVKENIGIKFFNHIYVPNFTSDISEKPIILNNFILKQNYPNPFNPGTTIEFYLPKESSIKLKTYNYLGKEIKTLINGTLSSGKHTYYWNAFDEKSNLLPSGVYFIQLANGNYTKTIKALLLK